MNSDFFDSAEPNDLRAQVELLRAENARLRAQNDRLSQTETRFQALLETQVLGVFIGSLAGEVLSMNRSFERILGRTPDQIGQFDWRDCAPPEEFARHEENARLVMKNGWCPAWETAMLRPDGTRVPVVTGATLIENTRFDQNSRPQERTVLIWALDISQRVNAENELRASESQMRAIVENLHDGLLLTDLQDTIFYANGRISELTGFSNAELVGQNAHRFLVDAALWAQCENRNHQRERGASGTYEIPLRHRDGSTRWMLINGSPLRNSSGDIIGTIGAHFDITERKHDEAELLRFSRRLEQSNRDLETFAFAVSHDLKQPLRKIEVFASRLQSEERAHLSDQGQLYLDRIGAASRRMTSLVDGLLAYSRVATGHAPWSPVDLNEITREVMLDLELAVERAGARVEIGDLPGVCASATQMRQLLQNLIGNALAYRRPDVPLVIYVSARTDETHYEIEIADNGRGFDPQHAEYIFEIFNRLSGNEDVGGAGVGLTICRGIVERHGGTLTAQSLPQQGATFCARLPFAPLESAQSAIGGNDFDH